MTRVIAKWQAVGSADEVYVGRPTKWGNPYTHKPLAGTIAKFQVASVEEAVASFERECQHLRAPAKRELKGKTLVCWGCKPVCHAGVLAKWADEEV